MSTKVARVTRPKKYNAKPATRDLVQGAQRAATRGEAARAAGASNGEVIGASRQDLATMLSKDVDDLKIAGHKKHVGQAPGKVSDDYGRFTTCGVHQTCGAESLSATGGHA